MAWNPDKKGNPAWLTKQASEHGGVDNYINDIRNEGYQEGHDQGVIEGIIITGVIFVAYEGIKHLVQRHKKQKRSVKKQAEFSKAALKQTYRENQEKEGENNE